MRPTRVPCLLAAAASLLWGETGLRLADRKLAAASEMCVGGEVAARRVERSAEGYVFTVYTLRVEARVFGPAAAAVEIWQAGGLDPLTGTRMIVPGIPHFEPGDRALVYLYRSRTGRLHVRGGEQGVRRAVGREDLFRRAAEARASAGVLEGRP